MKNGAHGCADSFGVIAVDGGSDDGDVIKGKGDGGADDCAKITGVGRIDEHDVAR